MFWNNSKEDWILKFLCKYQTFQLAGQRNIFSSHWNEKRHCTVNNTHARQKQREKNTKKIENQLRVAISIWSYCCTKKSMTKVHNFQYILFFFFLISVLLSLPRTLMLQLFGSFNITKVILIPFLNIRSQGKKNSNVPNDGEKTGT